MISAVETIEYPLEVRFFGFTVSKRCVSLPKTQNSLISTSARMKFHYIMITYSLRIPESLQHEPTNQVKLHHRYNSFIAHTHIHNLKKRQNPAKIRTWHKLPVCVGLLTDNEPDYFDYLPPTLHVIDCMFLLVNLVRFQLASIIIAPASTSW